MYILNVEDKFSAAHQLTTYKGPCENLHGHTWKLRLTVSGDTLDDAGMIIDFQVLKQHLRAVRDQFDHKFLNDLLPFSPTSENLSKYVYEEIRKRLPKTIHIDSVTIWESENAFVTYYD